MADEASRFFKKSIGSPMCAKFGHVLGKPGLNAAQEKILSDHFAKDCDHHGHPMPKKAPDKVQAQVAIGDYTVTTGTISSEAEKKQVNSCLGCKHFIEPSTVMDSFGWGSGMCAAKGKLLLGNRYREEADGCEYRAPGSSRMDVKNMALIPIYTEAENHNPISAFLARGGKPLVEPAEYPTDKPVEDDEKVYGIKAWRKIDDPHGTGKFTYLPVFDRDFFSPEEAAKIPATGDDEHPEWYIDTDNFVYSVAVEWMELDETPALWGRAGVGKTELGRHLAWLMQCPFDRISITKNSDVEDLIGKWLFVEGETTFQWGRLPHRWTKPGVLLLDEPNVGPEDVWQRIRPLTDNSKQLVLDEAGAEKVVRNPFCFFLMAMNPAWDSKNIGTNEISDADGSRLVHLYMPLPPENIERGILTQWARDVEFEVDDKTLDTVMSISRDIRAMVEDESLPITWGIRHNIKVIKHLKWFDYPTTYRRAAADKEEPAVMDMILGCVRANVE
jgi:MoxR-like ATPase